MVSKTSGQAITLSTVDCVKHFVDLHGSQEAMRLYQDFYPKSKPDTIRRWFRRFTPPVGIFLIQLQEFLQENGYRLTDLRNLEPEVIFLRSELAHERILFEDAAKRLQYSQPSWLHQVLRGNSKVGDEFASRLTALVKELGYKAEVKKPEPEQKNEKRPPQPPKPAVTPTVASEGMARKVADHARAILESLVGLSVEAGVTPRALTEGDRAQIRVALRELCFDFGIDATFREPERVFIPASRADLAKIGLVPDQGGKK